MQAVVTGATGFIGKRLCAELRGAGWKVASVTREAAKATETLGADVTAYAWSDADGWKRAVAEADAVFHLAGESIGGARWSPEFKAKILSSRVELTRAVAEANPRVLISASGTGYYGERGEAVVTEETPAGDDFLAKVCVAWEGEARRAEAGGGRVVVLRTGIALGKGGGALESMLQPPGVPLSPWKMGLGGPLGSGNQWMPWVHLDDLVRMYVWAAERGDLSGPVNAVAPKPVTNRDFSHALGHALDRPSLLPVPALALRAFVGEFAYALLYSQRVVPARAEAAGFPFHYPEVGPALLDVFRQGEKPA
jgi:uncharacterized protein